MNRREPQDVMERITNPRFKHSYLSYSDRIEVFRRAWCPELIDGYIVINNKLYCEALITLKFKNERTLSIKPEDIMSMAKTKRLLFNNSLGYSKEYEIAINKDIRPSIWKAACLAFLGDCNRVMDDENKAYNQSVNSTGDFIVKTQRAIIDIIRERYKASVITDVSANAHQRFFVMREPMVFDIESNTIIVKRSNLKKYLMNLGDLEYMNGVNINENLMILALHGLGFKRVNMFLRQRGSIVCQQCNLDVIDASLILDNAGAATDAAE